MKVFTYFHDCSIPEFPQQLINEWGGSFRDHGFEPVILDESYAQKHSRFSEIAAAVANLPTLNSREYERACWLRWLAYDMVAPGFFTDIDIVNFNFHPVDVVTSFPMMSHFYQLSPSVVYANSNGINYFMDQFKNADRWFDWETGKPHVSDMVVFRRTFQERKTPFCSENYHPDAMTSPLVHFGNAGLREDLRHANRYKAIEDFRKRRNDYNGKRQ